MARERNLALVWIAIGLIAAVGASRLPKPAHGAPGSAAPVSWRQTVSPAQVEEMLGSAFTRYTTTHFVVFSDCDPAWSQSRAALLERAAHQLQRVCRRIGIAQAPLRERLVCILFDRYDDYCAFAASQDGVTDAWIAGYYASRSNWVVFFNDSDSPAIRQAEQQLEAVAEQADELRDRSHQAARRGQRDEASRHRDRSDDLRSQLADEHRRLEDVVASASIAKTVHEAIHQLAFNTGVQSRNHEYPFWFTEGLATCFETDQPNAAFGPEHECDNRRRAFDDVLRADRLLPLRDFIQLTDVPRGSLDTAEVMYPQAYALLAYIYRTQRSALGDYLRAIQREPAGPISPDRQIELFETYFGPVDKLQRRWLKYERNR
ncbi:MAG: DUF1570 domain-containing protein [Phycisphaerales bacterium]|nr:DUF1570 domain-containing protein [Phycisphaerales bacterium]